jgi:toxin ParE1/3/4
VKLVWSRFALSDRDAIFSYIEAENPRAAIHVDEQIADAARRLLDFPDSGQTGRVAGTRELVIPRTPYVAAYLIEGDTVRTCACFTERRCGPTNLPMTIEAGSVQHPATGAGSLFAAILADAPGLAGRDGRRRPEVGRMPVVFVLRLPNGADDQARR